MKINKLILIIEDDVCINSLITELLLEQGYQTKSLFNGKDAHNWLMQTNEFPQLILLDLMMPIQNGYIFRDEQLKSQTLKNIPVVVMSADGNFSQNQMRINANDYLKKPFELNDFLTIINKYVKV